MIGVIGWAVLLGACFAWEGVALVRPHDEWPTLSDMLRLVTQSTFGRWALFAAWLWWGWHLFVRGWHFFLREPVSKAPSGAGVQSKEALAATPVSFEELLRQDIAPLLFVYAAVLAMLFYGARRKRDAAREGFVAPERPRSLRGWPALLAHVIVTAASGYGLFLAVVVLYYGLVAEQTPAFLNEAIEGGAFLAFAVAVPAFMLFSLIAGLQPAKGEGA